jgi:hypothetical protein
MECQRRGYERSSPEEQCQASHAEYGGSLHVIGPEGDGTGVRGSSKPARENDVFASQL